MMTYEERKARIDSAYNLGFALSEAAMKNFNAQSKLHNYTWNMKLPALIRESAQAAENKYWENYLELSRLSDMAYKAMKQTRARPFLFTGENGVTAEVPGMLPNCEMTSTDEAQALQMFTAYCVAKAYEIPEPIELPF